MAKDATRTLPQEARDRIERIVADTVTGVDSGFEVVEVRYTKEYGRFNLTVFIWHADEVTLDDCEKVHNALSDALDKVDDLFPDEYVLNVSSSGLDRPIVTDDDFRRALGTEIEAIAPECTYRGTLTAYTAEDFTILTGGKYEKEKTINRNNKTKVQPYIGF